MTDYKALTREIYATAVDGDESGVDEAVDRYLADDFVEHEEVPGLGSDRETARRLFKAMHAAISGLHVDVHELLQDGDKVVARITFEGTHTGELMGAAPSGRRIAIDGIDILEFRDDRCVAHWGVTDMSGVLAPAGANA